MGEQRLGDYPVADVADAVDAIVAYAHRLDGKETNAGEPISVPEAFIRRVMPELLTDHRGPVRLRKALRSGASRDARATFGMLRWHRSNGDLTGLFIARMTADDETACENLATLLLLLAGGRSPALDAWSRTGLIPTRDGGRP